MRIRTGAIRHLVLAGFWAATPLLACGDKFLVAGRGSRFQRGGARAPVVIYAPLSSTLRNVTGDKSPDSVLRRAGYKPAVVASTEDLGRVLKETGPSVVLVDRADAPTVERYAQPAPSGPVILPVLTTNASRQDLADARKTFGVALRGPTSADALLDAVAEAAELRAKSGKVAALKH